MARHLSVVVILAVAVFLVLSFMTSFGGKTEQIRQVLPAAGLTKQPLGASDAITADTKAHQKIDTAPDMKADVKADAKANVISDPKSDFPSLSSGILSGGAIAPKLENATIKAELGRSTWKFFHTMMARFPDKPTEDDSLALKTFIQLFARLYPCGDCARHFQKLLAQYPPQVSSRSAAAGWACFVHNQVNERLKKPIFDCTPEKLGDFYECGCGDDKKEGADSIGELKLEKEGLTKGG
ncbi:ERV/ALR sulfhydryl oxidase domain-containing protein [Daldinia loculata]|uniref:ERV/ALR sulfhydryl oxidase domain-containing protein n=1 Tax=Daldinia loculata TaxID=103429 RepID=UPI0020C2D6E7|nr:ERV/ALR sulfhydryl oxidase domain-containing protein [Daldinia loculata]KAI1641617.1 ERV/ALR sulfhydryl oxidase domain-containing protein [Daldinia loculata]KAI2769462.1 ERV/ALR sulfhydryl oxidase domain-containing protein [Daldinia loculata]